MQSSTEKAAQSQFSATRYISRVKKENKNKYSMKKQRTMQIWRRFRTWYLQSWRSCSARVTPSCRGTNRLSRFKQEACSADMLRKWLWRKRPLPRPANYNNDHSTFLSHYRLPGYKTLSLAPCALYEGFVLRGYLWQVRTVFRWYYMWNHRADDCLLTRQKNFPSFHGPFSS